MLELLVWKREKEVDAAAQEDERLPERRSPRGVVPLGRRRIGDAPVGGDRAAGELRADLPGAVTHGDHEIPSFAENSVDPLGLRPLQLMPLRRSASIVNGCTSAAGSVPALAASNRSPPRLPIINRH